MPAPSTAMRSGCRGPARWSGTWRRSRGSGVALALGVIGHPLPPDEVQSAVSASAPPPRARSIPRRPRRRRSGPPLGEQRQRQRPGGEPGTMPRPLAPQSGSSMRRHRLSCPPTGRVVVVPARTMASSAMQARATEAKNWSCHPHSRFAACPTWSRTSGKNASATLGTAPEAGAARIMRPAASAATPAGHRSTW